MSIQTSTSQMRCGKCRHLFDGEIATGVPVEVMVATMKVLRCPNCGAGWKNLLLGQGRTLAEDRTFEIGKSYEDRVRLWPVNGEIGQSAQAIHGFMTGRQRSKNFPHDASDFRRCVLLLHRVSEWLPRMPEMAALGDEWSRLAPKWAELQAAFVSDLGPELDGSGIPTFGPMFAAILEGK